MLVHGRVTIKKAYIDFEKFLAFIPRVVEERLVSHYPCGSDTCGFSIKSTLCPDKTYQLSMRPKSLLIWRNVSSKASILVTSVLSGLETPLHLRVESYR
jgi:hypothetical protein